MIPSDKRNKSLRSKRSKIAHSVVLIARSKSSSKKAILHLSGPASLLAKAHPESVMKEKMRIALQFSRKSYLNNKRMLPINRSNISLMNP
jgi:hypothetical protein